MDIGHLETLIENNQLQEIVNLLEQNPDLAVQQTSHQVSPILLACFYQKLTIANAIAQFVKELDIYDACATGKFEEVSLLVYKNPSVVHLQDNFGFTPLGLACFFAHEEIAKFLVLKAADVNIASKNGYNVFPIHSAALANNFNITQMLLQAGAYPNVCQKNGITALHTAAQLGNIEMIIALLEHGADITLKNDEGKRPADLAAEKGFSEISAILSDED